MSIFSASSDKLNGQRPASRRGYSRLYCQTAYFLFLYQYAVGITDCFHGIDRGIDTYSSGILHDGRLYLKPGPEVQCQIHLLGRAAIITETCSKITGDYKTQS